MRDRDDVLRIRKLRRIYNRHEDKFTFHVEYETIAEITPRTLVVAEAFGLGIDEAQKFLVLNTILQISPRDIVLVTGDSGSGKSVLLRALREDLGSEAVDMTDVKVDENKPLIDTIGATVEEALELLSKVGLNDAFLFLRPYKQLSDGQKYRYRIAKLIESKAQWWLMDEFCALLDRDTAKIIAFNVQKLARQQGKAVIVATTHGDLFEDLAPSVNIHKRFGEEIQIDYYTNIAKAVCTLMKEMKVEEGTREDWAKLCRFHYRGHGFSVARKFFRVTRNGELCGVIIYSFPPPACYGRRMILPIMSMQEINQQLSTINRVVIHPKYRTIGLGAKLIRESLPLAGTPYVELIAVMAKYNPFAEKAGMKKITQQTYVESVSRVSKALTDLGFTLQLLGSSHYVESKLQTLSSQEMSCLKESFGKNGHPRFKKVFSGKGQPYGKGSAYFQHLQDADLLKMAKLIKIASMLLQTKVYLFWKKNSLTSNIA